MALPKSEHDAGRRYGSRRDAATHPVWKANLLMLGIVLLLLALSMFSVAGGR